MISIDQAKQTLPHGFSGTLVWLSLVFSSAFTVKTTLTIIYNLFFHPLRHFPGPWFAAATPLPFVFCLWSGGMVQWTDRLHRKYGGVVRVQPDELSFVEASAWQDIFRSRPQLPKALIGSIKSANDERPIATILQGSDHAKQRRVLGHAFSDRALKEQEYILQRYSDLLIKRLNDVSSNGEEVGICNWYMFTTFDIVGDLCFGESFQSLSSAEHHPWVAGVFNSLKFAQIIISLMYLPPLDKILKYLMPSFILKKVKDNFEYCERQIDKRIERKSDRPDFMRYILENNHEDGLTKAEIDSTIHLLILAGSETSATVLTSATWFSLTNPHVWDELKREIRDSFKNYDDITVASVSDLPYLHAALQEALRLHPPGPVSVPREVDRPDVVISGRSVPMKTRVGISQKTAYRLRSNFVDPDSYVPERWLPDGDSKYTADDKASCQPFMVGPRNCIGKSLAWAEMKLILSKVIWSFNIELTANNKADWADQRIWLLHEKGALNVRLKATT